MVLSIIVMIIVGKILYDKDYKIEKLIPIVLLVGIALYYIPDSPMLGGALDGIENFSFGQLLGNFIGMIGELIGFVFSLLGSIIVILFSVLGVFLKLIFGGLGLVVFILLFRLILR